MAKKKRRSAVQNPQPTGRAQSQLAVDAIARCALEDGVAALALGSAAEVIQQNCRRSPYWRAFCALAKAGRVPRGFAGPAALGACVIGWAREEAA